ncbi:acyl-CoA dehydrogenase family protein [Streptomyces hoynatensis]|uniref:Acyl-CoA dehydrogenase n=1 Tax=Streptomyces hoynatensis TaxID=1141874 RepID=A0A3A9YZC2_9ACTN|nr:acyl-CoA dehydrogenase family protein [Streptomyces hoynatensis]RKN41220.1 acyl-CoA dehydrogenase [Streptomyces hoynatensis]
MTPPQAGPVAETTAALDVLLDTHPEASAALDPATLSRLDEESGFPREATDLLDRLGVPALYVPTRFGGRLESQEELFHVLRVLGRRDVTVAVAHFKTYLGAVSVWLAGRPEQAERLGREIIAGSRVSWALSEPEHGADLLAGEVTATREEGGEGGYVLSGVKWLINNATLGSHWCVLARTSQTPGSRSHSLLLVGKEGLPEGSYRPLPKVATVGIRGADISGVGFEDTRVPATALVGQEGKGVETVLRGLQLTRTACAGLSAGAGEHALRIATAFAAEHQVGGRPLIERPHVREVLARSAATLLAVEAVGRAGARSAHALTDEMSVISALTKAVAPTLADGLIRDLADLLGSRSHLAAGYAHGAFQKALRDHQIVGIFDGSTVVNRHAVVNHFPRLARNYASGTADLDGVAEATALGSPVRPLDPTRLQVMSRTGCSIVQALPAVAARVARAAAAGEAPATLAEAAGAAEAAVRRVHERMARVAPSPKPPIAAFDLAAAYELGFAAAVCLHVWERRAASGADARSAAWDEARWVEGALWALLDRLGEAAGQEPRPLRRDLRDGLVDWLAEAVAKGEPLTLFARQATGNDAVQEAADER